MSGPAPEVDSISDDVRAAFNSVAERDNQPGAPEPSTPSVIPPPKVEKAEGERDAHGRFLPKNKDEIPPLTEPPKAPEAKAPEAKAPAAPTDPNAPVKLDASKPPQGWTPAMKEKWTAVPEDIKAEIIRREEDMAAGVQRIMQQTEPMRQVWGVLEPYAQYFDHIDMHPVEYLSQVIASEQILALGNPAQKFSQLLEIADGYGIPIRKALDEAMGGKLQAFIEESHKHHKTPPSIPPEIAQELAEQRQWRASLEQSAAKNELDVFAADTAKHPFLAQVRDQMADVIEAGICETYEDAYDYCVWKDPALRAKANGAAQPTPVQQRQVAAAAVVPPASSGLSVGASEDGLGDDVYADVRRAFAAQSQGV